MSSEIEYPEEGEFVVVTVQGIEKNGAYLSLQGYSDDIRASFSLVRSVRAGLLVFEIIFERDREPLLASLGSKKIGVVSMSQSSPSPMSVDVRPFKIGRTSSELVSCYELSPSV